MERKRIIGLDIIRGIAILLVLFRHGDYACFLNEIGWIGVDFFFVLSGFLVSGLLFKEFKKDQKVRIKRFLIRRSLKIMPSFYFFILVSILISLLLFKIHLDPSSVLHELIYIQNYASGIHGHTWSLAVEEQFYIGFALLMFIAFKANWLTKKTAVLTFLSIVILGIAFWRGYLSYLNLDSQNQNSFIGTHLRIDGILLGVLASYLSVFTSFNAFIKRWALALFLLALSFIAPIALLDGDPFYMTAFGMFSMNLGFVLLVVLGANVDLYKNYLALSWVKPGANLVAFIGVHSYSIYLWHSVVKQLILKSTIEEHVAVILYFILTVSVGIIISLLLEKPILKVRNRLFP